MAIPALVRRRYRMDLDIRGWIEPLDRAECLDSWLERERMGVDQPDFEIGFGRQQRLLEVIARDDRVVEAWLHDEAGFAIESLEAHVGAPEEDILEPVLTALPPQHRLFFEAGARDRIGFIDHISGLTESTPTTLVSVELPPQAVRVTPERGLAERRFRAIAVTGVAVHEIDPAKMAKLLASEFVGEHLPPGLTAAQYTDHQRALVQALVRDEDTLEAWLRDAAMCGLAWRFEPEMLPAGPPEEERLAPAIDRLPPDDRAYFRDAIEREAFWDVAEPALFACRSELEAVWLRQLEADDGGVRRRLER